MKHTPKWDSNTWLQCGCHLGYQKGYAPDIYFCPKHDTAPDLLQAARCALADLEGLRDEGVFYYDDGEPKPPQIETIEELQQAIAKATKDN